MSSKHGGIIYDTRGKSVAEVTKFVWESGLGSGAAANITEFVEEKLLHGHTDVICVWLDGLTDCGIGFVLCDNNMSFPDGRCDLHGFVCEDGSIKWVLSKTHLKKHRNL